jgi:predicted MFS family arabinose efflux permease
LKARRSYSSAKARSAKAPRPAHLLRHEALFRRVVFCGGAAVEADGLIDVMVFSHLPANILLALTAFAPSIEIAFTMLILRALLSEMDSPTRSSYIMAVVQPEERPAAASVTAVPRSLAAAAAPVLSGWLLSLSLFGWPLVAAGCLKGAYDLALLWQFSKIKPPEEA